MSRGAEPGSGIFAGAPLGLGALVRAAARLYATRPGLYVPAFFAVYVLLHGAQAIGLAGMDAAEPTDLVRAVGELLLGVVLGAVLGTFLVAATSVWMTAAALGGEPGAGGALRRIWGRADQVLGAGLLAAMLSMLVVLPPLGFLLLVLGTAVILSLLHGPPIVIHCIVLERLPVRPALARSRELMRGAWARSIGHMLTIALGVALLHVVLFAVASAAIGGVERLDVQLRILLVVVQAAVSAATLPFVAAAWLAVYVSVRIQRDDDALEDLRSSLAQTSSDQAGFTGP